jgi:eukaryotic-like serine/threonine-protein kinase
VRRGDYYHSVGLHNNAVTNYELAMQHGGDTSSLRRKFAYLYCDIYQTSAAANQVSAAMESLRKAEAHFESVNNLGAFDYYNLACTRSLLSALIGRESSKSSPDNQAEHRKYADKAIGALHIAVRAGYKDTFHMKRDPDLDTLRSRPDFQLLMMDVSFPSDPFVP